MRSAEQRYTAVAIVLHWAIATAIVGNIAVGWWMRHAIEVAQTQARAVTAFQLHKSLGLTILFLSLVRLAWRWLHRPPPLPAAMPAWEKLAAKATHWAFYALMIGIPLSGWLYVSTQWRGNAPLNIPTLWFGLFEIPHLLGLNEMERELRSSLAGVVLEAHELLAWSTAALLALHVAAALKHHFVNHDEVLGHMIPALRARDESAPAWHTRWRTATLAGGFAIIVIAAAAFATALLRTPTGAVTGSVAAPAAEGAVSAITSKEGGWVLVPAQSEITFSGVHAGAAFRGRFTRWSAELRIDPVAVTQSHIAATIETGSATDGVPLHDETLPLAEWFDVASHPVATFRTVRISHRDGQQYAIEGTLNIKGRDITLPPLNLEIVGDRATISGRVTINRRDADLGMESDPHAEWVSREIVLDVLVTATRPP